MASKRRLSRSEAERVARKNRLSGSQRDTFVREATTVGINTDGNLALGIGGGMSIDLSDGSLGFGASGGFGGFDTGGGSSFGGGCD